MANRSVLCRELMTEVLSKLGDADDAASCLVLEAHEQDDPHHVYAPRTCPGVFAERCSFTNFMILLIGKGSEFVRVCCSGYFGDMFVDLDVVRLGRHGLVCIVVFRENSTRNSDATAIWMDSTGSKMIELNMIIEAEMKDPLQLDIKEP